MFTGIIKGTGIIEKSFQESGALYISSPLFSKKKPALGASVAVDGVCLTVCSLSGDSNFLVRFDLGKETCARTLLAQYHSKAEVNLEEALCLGDPLDGHMVQGHVDGLVKLIKRVDFDEFCLMSFSFEEDLGPLLVKKGSLAINGVSLTINEVGKTMLSVGLVPYTLQHTCLRNLQEGDQAHLETDIVGRYVAKQCQKL